VTGFLLVDKPPGPTSHDVVARVRTLLRIKRVGHAGTLDPLASGLLVVAIGPATRMLSYVQGLPKTYEATARLGIRTTTLDAAGEIVDERAVAVGDPEIVRAAADFVGEIEHVPPAHSAVKVGGERAYERARRGETPELAPRRVTVYRFDITRVENDQFHAMIECSSGTYIRSLIRDVGDRLGCGAHVAALRRTAIGHLSVEEAIRPDHVSAAAVMPVERVLAHLEVTRVDGERARMAGNGRAIDDGGGAAGDVLVCGPHGAIGVFRRSDGLLRPITVLGH
jgi:tRNA pseudouridine55 synthase